MYTMIINSITIITTLFTISLLQPTVRLGEDRDGVQLLHGQGGDRQPKGVVHQRVGREGLT